MSGVKGSQLLQYMALGVILNTIWLQTKHWIVKPPQKHSLLCLSDPMPCSEFGGGTAHTIGLPLAHC